MASSNSTGKIPEPGIGLCLSGGGYRAALFHLGTLWRLNELGYLSLIKRISSVSGGTIVSAYVGSVWCDKLKFQNGVAQNFEEVVVDKIRDFTSKNLDIYIILMGLFNPFGSIAGMLINTYRKHLFDNRTLQCLPDEPEFFFNASNVQSGALWRFSKSYMEDYLVGEVQKPTLELAVAAAASSAFPPFLSPVRFKLKPTDFTPNTEARLQREPFTTNVVLMDGGVYDNLGLEPVWKKYETVLVSDAGGILEPSEKPSGFWGSQAYRLVNLIDNQVRDLRKRQLVDLYELRQKLLAAGLQPEDPALRLASRKGSYWSTYGNMAKYPIPGVLDCPYEKTIKLANISTRLKSMSQENQERLINWGYAICDASMRMYVNTDLPADAKFPYARGVN